MNKRSFVFGIATILFIAVYILAGCEQMPENGNGSGRENPFELDSALLIEVWDSSTPPKFLGYDTGLYDWRDGSYSLILTSKGYCVSLWNVRYIREGKRFYGDRADWDQGISYDDPLAETMRNTGWGYAVFFDTTSDPTANDTPYALWSSNIVNNVMFNPHNGGTYYTWDTNAAPRAITISADYKFYDNMGVIHTWNDDYDTFGEWQLREYLEEYPVSSSALIGKAVTFQPLKKIGGYAELGLPNPDDVTPPLIYKVTY
jgi:hypothetical protein